VIARNRPHNLAARIDSRRTMQGGGVFAAGLRRMRDSRALRVINRAQNNLESECAAPTENRRWLEEKHGPCGAVIEIADAAPGDCE